MQTLWDHRYAQRTQRMSGSIIRELLKLTEQEDVISFAGACLKVWMRLKYCEWP
jgi:2-aminoadipate transaminase